VVVVLAYLAAEGRGFDFAAYYPTKMMWFFVLMASPAVAATVGVLLGALLRRAPALGRTWRAFRAVPVLRFVWWPLVAVALVSVALPWAMAFPPDSAVAATGWSRFPESRVLLHLATDAPLPEGGRVLPLDMLLENSIPMPNARAALQQVALKLLWFRLGTNQAEPYPSNFGDTGYVCSLIRSSSTPTAVVTARDPRTVRSDLAVAGCPGATVVGLSAG